MIYLQNMRQKISCVVDFVPMCHVTENVTVFTLHGLDSVIAIIVLTQTSNLATPRALLPAKYERPVRYYVCFAFIHRDNLTKINKRIGYNCMDSIYVYSSKQRCVRLFEERNCEICLEPKSNFYLDLIFDTVSSWMGPSATTIEDRRRHGKVKKPIESKRGFVKNSINCRIKVEKDEFWEISGKLPNFLSSKSLSIELGRPERRCEGEYLDSNEGIMCGLCSEPPLKKKFFSERRFGILRNCEHAFCYTCIRKQCASSDVTLPFGTVECPTCLVSSVGVASSSIWLQGEEEKKAFFEEFNKSIKQLQGRVRKTSCVETRGYNWLPENCKWKVQSKELPENCLWKVQSKELPENGKWRVQSNEQPENWLWKVQSKELPENCMWEVQSKELSENCLWKVNSKERPESFLWKVQSKELPENYKWRFQSKVVRDGFPDLISDSRKYEKSNTCSRTSILKKKCGLYAVV